MEVYVFQHELSSLEHSWENPGAWFDVFDDSEGMIAAEAYV